MLKNKKKSKTITLDSDLIEVLNRLAYKKERKFANLINWLLKQNQEVKELLKKCKK